VAVPGGDAGGAGGATGTAGGATAALAGGAAWACGADGGEGGGPAGAVTSIRVAAEAWAVRTAGAAPPGSRAAVAAPETGCPRVTSRASRPPTLSRSFSASSASASRWRRCSAARLSALHSLRNSSLVQMPRTISARNSSVPSTSHAPLSERAFPPACASFLSLYHASRSRQGGQGGVADVAVEAAAPADAGVTARQGGIAGSLSGAARHLVPPRPHRTRSSR